MRECRHCHKKKELKEFYENKGIYSRVCLECNEKATKKRHQRIEKARNTARGIKPNLLVSLLNKIRSLL